ncbi:Ankyrin repeat-containing domain protein [Lactarius tabidus]
MASSSETLDSSSHLKSILEAALSDYKAKTGNDLTNNSLAKELQDCVSVEAVLDIIQREAKAFDKFRGGTKRLMKWIGPSVNVLCTISATLGQGVGMVFPSANVVSAGIGVLLVAAKDVKASHDVLVDLFERVQFFLKRLGVHATRIAPNKDMAEILVKIMVEVLSILAIATKEVQQSRTKTYLKKLFGRTDIEDALKRLDDLTREEVQLAIALILKATKELKDDAMRSNDAVEQMANTVNGIKDNMDEMKGDMGDMMGDVDEMKDNLDEIMVDLDEMKDDMGEMKDVMGEIKDDMGEIKDDVVGIKWNQIEQDVRKWFSPPDPSVNYNAACEAYQKGTAAWFLQGTIFKEWELIDSLLWIHGKPGSGKSILSSAIIKHVMSLRDASHASLAYFFFDFRDKEKQSVRNFLTSLLIQLSSQLEPCRKMISWIYWAHGNGTQEPSIDLLSYCLYKMLFFAARRPIYVIVDAIDECPNISGLPTPRAVLLDLLEELVELHIPNLHICITSRPEIDIKDVLEPLAYSAISLHDESGQQKDISHYVRKTVYSNRKMRRWLDQDKQLVVKVLSEKADGMFRWVFCQLAVLQHCLASTIRQTLDRLPRTLDETYACVLSQIPQESQDHAHRMLQCLMVALRPLRVEEFAELLAFEFKARGVPKYRTDWRPNDQVEAVLSTCSSLISIVDDNGSQIVQFSHFSVKEFLMSDRLTSSLGDFSQYQILPRPAHTILAQACLGCLLHLDGHVDERTLKGFPLAEYAAKHWVTHAQFEDVASRVIGGMETLFDCDKHHFAAWVGIHNMDEESSLESLSGIPNPLYYSSLCGFSDLVEHLFTKHPRHVNAVGGKYKFPLLAALVGKHIKVAGILLKHGANVDIRGLRERTPLHEAIANVGMVQSLLNKGADVNCRQDDLRTPLHLAVYHGELKVARVLVEHKANVDSQDNTGKIPLYLLLEDTSRDDNDILDLVQLLLEHVTDVNIRTTDKWTLLHVAAFRGRLEIVRMLLDRDANPDVQTKGRETPLHLISRGEYDSEEHGVGIVRLLLEHGVDIHAQDKDHDTALHSAAFSGRLEITRLLLGHGADPNVGNDHGSTPLHHVSGGKYNPQENGVGIARLLLERGVDVNAREKEGWTSLHQAAFKGRVEVARVLLEHGANANMATEAGSTALHIVSRGEYDSQEQGVSTARLLLERGVDVNARRKDSWTSLHRAAFKGRVEVARVLLEHGANANMATETGETALHIVSLGEYDSQEQGVSTARLLLERGVDVNAREKDGLTSLHRAAFKGRVEVARVLLEHGANANMATEAGSTALHIVSRGKYDSQEQGVSTARLLLERGVDVNARRKDSWTSLHCAAFEGRVEVAQVLLDHGANINMATEAGSTALHIVSRGEYDTQEQGVSTARLLLERGVDVNAREKDGWTPLHWAAFKGRVEVTQVLLEHGANASIETKGGETALHIVSRGEYDSEEHGVGIARLLLEHGVDVHVQNKYLNNSLHLAALRGKLEITRLLLDHGANANVGNIHGSTPLHQVSAGKYISQDYGVSVAQLFIERGVDVNARKKKSWTPLHSAAFSGRLDMARFLLKNGANANAKTVWGETSFHLASWGNYDSEEHGIGIVRLLMEHGMDVHAQTKFYSTALHYAAVGGRCNIVQLLLDIGLNPNAENEQGRTPLHSVSRGKQKSQERVGIARLLLERGVDVNSQEKNSWTLLHSAVFNGRLDIAQVLLDHGANANAENDEGKTPLHLVSQGDYDSQEHGVGIARLLLERSVDVHAQDKDYDTPLHSAAFGGMLEIARVLLDHGANVNAGNKQGRTPLHQVAQGTYDSQESGVGVARLFLERGGDVHAQDKEHDTALHSAAFSGRLEIAKLLLNHGAITTAENEHGETPLHLVSRGQNVSQENGVGIVQLLLERGIDVNATDRHQNTSLHSASSLGKHEIARVLLDHGAKASLENDRAKTPLHIVSQGNCWFQDDGLGVVKLLLERGADIHARDEDDATPLHLACYRGRFDIARVLLDDDAKAQAENDEDAVPSPSQSIDIDARNEDQ